MDLYELTISQAHEKLVNKEISAKQLAESVFERIDQVEDKVGAYITLTKEQALKQAEAVDKKIAGGEQIGMLAGIPGGIKDLLCTEGVQTTAGSKILEGFVPPYDATAVKKLKEAGFVLIGKQNEDQYGMGSSTENSAYKKTANPWDLQRVPGGSSGGGAAGLKAGECLFSIGTDTGGSIRQPSAFCGTTGLKVTYGRVSRSGVVAYASSLDTIGPIARNAYDAALILQVLAGADPHDSTTPPVAVPNYTADIDKSIKGLKIGLPKECFVEGLDKQIEKIIMQGVDILRKQGAEIREVSLPHVKYALAAYYIIVMSEASANLARYDGIKFGHQSKDGKDLLEQYKKSRAEGFGEEAKRRIMLGTYALSAGYYDAYYLQAQKVRTLVKQDFEKALEEVDIMITPVTPDVAFKFGANSDDPVQMYLEDVFTISINMAGVPALSLPAGFKDGLPVGMQIISKQFSEDLLLRVGHRFQQETDHHLKTPKL